MNQHAVWLPLLIFAARIFDVSCGTFRTICIVRGLGLLAATIGFFEVLAWLGAVSIVVHHLNRPLNVLGYAAGFATGNYIGMWLESKLALGNQVVRLLSRDTTHRLADQLREAGFIVTELAGHGRDIPVTICFVAVTRRNVRALIGLAKKIDPGVLVTVEDVREMNFTPHRMTPQEAEWTGIVKMK
jgi:uncharacterized protein YebE (UPF0316 family)